MSFDGRPVEVGGGVVDVPGQVTMGFMTAYRVSGLCAPRGFSLIGKSQQANERERCCFRQDGRR